MATPQIPWARVLVEGVVIVASILLAFGIDAWWEGRQERERERQLLMALSAEFEGVEAEVRRARGVHARRLDAAEALIRILDDGSPFPQADSLWSLIANAYGRTTIDPPSGVLSGSIGAGTIALIRDDKLRDLLAGWPGKVADHSKTEENVRTYVNSIVFPWLAENDVFPPMSGATPEWRARVAAPLRSPPYRGHLFVLRGNTRSILGESDRLLEQIGEIQRLTQ